MSEGPPSRALRAAVRLYRALLRAYPRAFRRQYAEQMTQLFRDCARDALARHGTPGMLGWCVRALCDLARTASGQRLAAALATPPRAHRPLLGAVVLGLVTGAVNARSTAAQPPMLCLLLSTAALGLWAPRLAWCWALLIGGAVPTSQALAFALHLPLPYPNDARHVLLALPVLLPALLGGAAGAALSRLAPRGWDGLAHAEAAGRAAP